MSPAKTEIAMIPSGQKREIKDNTKTPRHARTLVTQTTTMASSLNLYSIQSRDEREGLYNFLITR